MRDAERASQSSPLPVTRSGALGAQRGRRTSKRDVQKPRRGETHQAQRRSNLRWAQHACVEKNLSRQQYTVLSLRGLYVGTAPRLPHHALHVTELLKNLGVSSQKLRGSEM